MTTLSILSFIIGLVGIIFGGGCYLELRKWARLCQHGRIFIAYNNRVKLEGPITEWIQWTRMLTKDEASTGRIIYQANKMKVGITHRKPDTTAVKQIKTQTPGKERKAAA